MVRYILNILCQWTPSKHSRSYILGSSYPSPSHIVTAALLRQVPIHVADNDSFPLQITSATLTRYRVTLASSGDHDTIKLFRYAVQVTGVLIFVNKLSLVQSSIVNSQCYCKNDLLKFVVGVLYSSYRKGLAGASRQKMFQLI